MNGTRVISAAYGRDSDCTVRLKSNNTLFEVLLSTESPKTSIEYRYLQRISDQDETLVDQAFEDLYDELSLLILPYIEVASVQEETPPVRSQTLHDVLHPSKMRFCLRTNDGQATLCPKPESPTLEASDAWQPHIKEFAGLPVFVSSEIEVLKVLQMDRAFKVSKDGTTFCAKISRGLSDRHSMSREIACLHRLREAGITPLRYPTIHGLVVRDDHNESVVGFVMEYIEPRVNLHADLSAWNDDVYHWADTIERTIREWHEHGIIWGDAKVDNIIIRSDGDGTQLKPCIVDFGGSWSSGWVDQSLCETKEGDLQGIHRIREFLCRTARPKELRCDTVHLGHSVHQQEAIKPADDSDLLQSYPEA
ncbi:hypothetical protein EJ05DRAFT_497869 [Pseudovirgaria hyperparasitica]|uniref:Protein kinase domain-containing protein n=1 Tax=Pseudovirgaria hyperparasitica TaxID=470096 RepID=A0A6A6WI43_9PEZI|nr:uncharacterized protein EJ05DRAFT_497869 [Pseudovirgaria hyperparasitica]KAF2761317.1 hypothetical protein EJ05DRAFT_497869 [Pseudovirgaria hyperparasitica]